MLGETGLRAVESEESESEDTEPAAAPSGQAGHSTRSLLIAWARRLVVVAVIGYVGYQLAREWPDVARTLAHLPWPRLVLSCVAVTAGVLLGPLVWHSMVSDVGEPVRVRDSGKVYLVGQLGKYVPGSVMAFLMQVELARTMGVSRTRSMTASLLTAGIAIVASLVAGTLAIPAFLHNEPRLLWLFVLLPVGLAMLHPVLLTYVVNRLLRLIRRHPLRRRLSWHAIGRATGVSVLIYVLYGVHLYALVGALPSARGTSGGVVFLLCVGGMGLAMTAGLMAFILPSGIGAREAVIVAALLAVATYGQALALAIVSRLMFTVVELASAGAAAAFARSSSRSGQLRPDTAL